MKADGRPIADFDVTPLFFAAEKAAAPAPQVQKILLQKLNSGKPGTPDIKLWGNRDPKHMLEKLATDPSASTGR